MKLLRIGQAGAEKPALLDAAGTIRDLSGVVPDIAGDVLGNAELARIAAIDPEALPVVSGDTRIGPCVGHVGKFICIGLNYRDQASAAGIALPASPTVFFKATSAIAGPNDPVTIPKDSRKTDWEVELGVIMGTTARHVTEETALAHVAGYCVINDLSERAYQFESAGQFVLGKSCDGFGPIGPWLVTRDEVETGDLSLWLDVDGTRYQNGTTRDMIFSVAHLISYLSRYMTLHPGDVIATGTPSGVGMTQQPPIFLRPGQRIRLGLDGLGVQEQTTLAWSD